LDGNCKGNVSVRINDSWLCGWHYENFYDRKLRVGEKIPLQESRFRVRLEEINIYLADYRRKSPGATNREACLRYLKSLGLHHAIPDAIRAESEAEAIAERQAIVNEQTT
jgi:hypothetical protein